MFNRRLFHLLTVICFSLPLTSISQWTQTGGPEGGYVADLVELDNTLIASAGNSGIYRSFDNGDSWEISNSGLPNNPSVQSMIEHNGALYASVYQGGIYKSIDEGATWAPVNTGIEWTTSYKMLVDGTNIYAGNANGGVFYSPDDGASWSVKSNGIENIQFQDFLAFNNKVYASGFGLYETSDDGDNWTLVDIPGVGPNGVRSMTVKDGVFYAAGDGKIYISTDNLVTWSTTDLGIGASILSMGSYDDFVYLTTSYGKYYTSTDSGVTWTLHQNPETTSFPLDMLFMPNKIIMSTTDGLYRSLDDGVTWASSNTGIQSLRIESLGYNSSYLFAGTERNGVFRTADDGQTWTKINTGIDGLNGRTIYDIITLEGDTFLATGAGIYASSDNGENWDYKFNPGVNKSAQALAYEEGVFVTAVNGSGIYTSSDMAETWTLINTNGLNINTSYTSILLQGSTIVVATHDAEIFISDNLGTNWSDITIPDGFFFTQDLELKNGKLLAATAQGLWASDDLGTTWSKYAQNDWNSVQDIIVVEDIVYAATAQGIKVTAEDRYQLYEVNEGLGNQYVNEILIKDGQIYAGADSRSVWKRTLDEIVLPPVDSDNDGVINELDSCPNTEPGRIVGERGCDIIATDAISIYTQTPTCPNLANGTIEVSTVLEGYSFDINLVGEGKDENLTEQTLIENVVFNELSAGTYEITISIPSIFYWYTYGVTINEAHNIVADKKTVDLSDKTVSYLVYGSTEYTVSMNDKTEVFTFNSTEENEIKLVNLQATNNIVISGKSDCQGKFTDSFELDGMISLYPTLTKDKIFIEGAYEDIQVNIYGSLGQLVIEKQLDASVDKIVNLENCTAGLYFVHIKSKGTTTTYKIIKQ